jgi:ABC-type bacteriocin/lantibiotic exporter with double-glycine peptidase domain
VTAGDADAEIPRLDGRFGPHASGSGGLVRLLFALAWTQRYLLIPALGAASVLTVLALAPPVLLAHLIDVVFPAADAAAVVAVGAGIACIALMDAASSLTRRALAARAGVALRRDILVPAFAAVLRLPADHALAGDQGLLGRTFEEAERLAQGATEGMLEFAMGAGMIVVLAAAMLYVSMPVGLAVTAIVAALAVLHVALARNLRRRETAWFEARSGYWSHVVEAVAYAGTVRFNSAHRFVEARFSERLDSDIGAHLAVMDMSTCLDAAGRFAGGLVIAAIAIVGGLRVVQGAMSVGDFVLFLSVGGSLSVPVLALVKAFDDFQAMMISAARMAALAQAPCEDIPSCAGAVPHGPGRLAIDGLSFSYPGTDARVLSGFSCAFEAGEKVALVGPSGIGKTTLASLIFAVRHADNGTITLDGVPLADLPLAELRRRIVVVPHEIDVFTGTVADNIVLGFAPADRGDVTAAAALACIDAEIRALPHGYDTLLGQGGVELSAGQKQRLGIARALLRSPGILVLDESTSSLDLATERRVLDALISRLRDTTVIAITHRASVVERMDRVVHLGMQETAREIRIT